MTDQYAELRAALAEGPMPGPWADDDGAIIQDVGSGSQVASVCGSTLEHHNAANARYIAAANPETITALLAERDSLLQCLREIVESVKERDREIERRARAMEIRSERVKELTARLKQYEPVSPWGGAAPANEKEAE